MTLLGDAIEIDNREVIFLTRNRRVTAASDRAREWLVTFFSHDPRSTEELPETVARWLRSQIAARSHENLAPPAVPLVVGGSEERLVIRWVPGGLAAVGDLVLVERQPPNQSPPPALIAEALGLSPWEAEALAKAARGRTNAEIGDRPVVSERTVEKHLAHVSAKLGVTTRTAAVALALRLPRDH